MTVFVENITRSALIIQYWKHVFIETRFIWRFRSFAIIYEVWGENLHKLPACVWKMGKFHDKFLLNQIETINQSLSWHFKYAILFFFVKMTSFEWYWLDILQGIFKVEKRCRYFFKPRYNENTYTSKRSPFIPYSQRVLGHCAFVHVFLWSKYCLQILTNLDEILHIGLVWSRDQNRFGFRDSLNI